MKSTTTYEMHNYAAKPSVSRSDANVNDEAAAIIGSSAEKYSLRQRHKRGSAATPFHSYLSDDNNNNNSSSHCEREHCASGDVITTSAKAAKAKSAGRKRTNGATNASSTNNNNNNNSSSTTTTKAKTKAPPLSKYRRKTANARERTRMREINSAFENLRHCVPHTITGDVAAHSNEKLTKITTLRLAMKYIQILGEALVNPSFEADFLLECQRDGDHRFTTHNWQQPPRVASPAEADFDDQDFELKASPAPKVTSKPAKNATAAGRSTPAASLNPAAAATQRKAPAKRQTKKQKLQQSISPYNSSSGGSTCSSLSTSAYASLSSAASSSASNSSSYLIDSPVNAAYVHNLNHSMSDLSSPHLESDGDSLHRSESCLSPPNDCVVPSTTAFPPADHQQLPVDVLSPFDQMSSTLENPLELSLRLLDSSADSLDFSGDAVGVGVAAAPSSCMSPLVSLDAFNPFSDLLHGDFPEHGAFDLFLA